MSERYTDQIEWDNDISDVYESDLDGSGTREGLVQGWIRTPRGVYEYEATGSQGYPYMDKPDIDESTIEEVGFTPAEPDVE